MLLSDWINYVLKINDYLLDSVAELAGGVRGRPSSAWNLYKQVQKRVALTISGSPGVSAVQTNAHCPKKSRREHFFFWSPARVMGQAGTRYTCLFFSNLRFGI